MKDAIETYLLEQDVTLRPILIQLRQWILACDEEISERIAWGVPTYYAHGYLVQIAAGKNYVGFYTRPTVLQTFQKALQGYDVRGKNTLRIYPDTQLDENLIKQMVDACLQENKQKR